MIQKYIYAGGAAVIAALLLALVIVSGKLDTRTAQYKAEQLKVVAANTSVDDLTKALGRVRVDLQNKEKAEIRKQAEIQAALRTIARQDKTLEDLEARLKVRAPETQCKTPKELRDAFSRL